MDLCGFLKPINIASVMNGQSSSLPSFKTILNKSILTISISVDKLYNKCCITNQNLKPVISTFVGKILVGSR